MNGWSYEDFMNAPDGMVAEIYTVLEEIDTNHALQEGLAAAKRM